MIFLLIRLSKIRSHRLSVRTVGFHPTKNPGTAKNSERFMIENLNTLNGKVVGDKHVKSILIGEDGSTIKL